MRFGIVSLLLLSQLLSGCAAALVYDRDRPSGSCTDPQKNCHSSALPTGDRHGTGGAFLARDQVLSYGVIPGKT